MEPNEQEDKEELNRKNNAESDNVGNDSGNDPDP